MLLHVEQMKSFYRGLASGELFPRWEEDTNRGFGAPTTSYYPPGVYYLTSALYALSGDWMIAVLASYFLMMAASSAAIYIFARRFLSRVAAAAAMVCYIFLPYHLLDQYQRGALAECLAFVFMPLMLLFAERLLAERGEMTADETSLSAFDGEPLVLSSGKPMRYRTLFDIALLSVATGAFIWSHPPTAYQFLLAFVLFTVIAAVMRRNWKGFLAVSIATILGLALSAAYLYPAFIEQELIRHEFVTDNWPYYSSYMFTHNAVYNLNAFAWVFNAAAIAIGGATLLVFERRVIKQSIGLQRRIWLWVIIGFYASFMMTPASSFVSRLIPRIEIGVFAWRMLGITTLAAAVIAGACVQAAVNARRRQQQSRGNSLASLAAVTIVGGAIFGAVRIVGGFYGHPSFFFADEHCNPAMMPKAGPVEPLELPRVERAELANEQGVVEVADWRPQHRRLNVNLSAPDTLLIRTFNFPGWRATVDGQPVAIQSGEALRVDLDRPDQALIRAATFRGGTPIVDGTPGKLIGTEPLGDIEIPLSPGAHFVTLDYVLTPPRFVGVLLSSSAFVLVLGLLLPSLIMRLLRARRDIR